MNLTTKFGFIKRPIIAGTLVFVALVVLTQLIAYQHYQLFESTKYREEINAANLAKEKLQKALSNSQSATKTLSFIVKHYGIKNDFDTVGKQILESNQYVDAIELLKGGTIKYVYPLKGNESVIGYNILADSKRNIEAEKAIEKRGLFFAGPFALKQGGVSIVGRLPIFIDNKFWGFSVTLVKLSTLINAAGFDTSVNSEYVFQLSKINPETHKEEFYLPDSKTFDTQKAVWVDVPVGEWRIYAMRRDPETIASLLPFSLLGLLFSVTGGLFAFFISRQPYALRRLVDEQNYLIRKSEENYKNTLDRVSDAFASVDLNWNIIYMNQKAGDLFKRDPASVIGKNIWKEFEITEDKQLYQGFQQAMAEQKHIYQNRLIARVGLWFEIFIYPSPTGLSVFMRDITGKKKAEDEADREKYLSDAIINSLPGIFYLFNKGGRNLRWNKNFELISGYNSEELGSMHPTDFFDEEEKEILRGKIAEALSTGMAEVEGNLVTKSGKKIPYYFNGYAAIFEGEECVIGMGIDITKRRKAEIAIRESEEKYRYLFNNNPALIFIWSLETLNILEVNQTATEEYGYTYQELTNMTVLELRPADDYDRVKDFAAKMLQSQEATVRATWRHINKKGELMYMDIRSHTIIYNNCKAILSIAENVTQKLKIEEQLNKSYEDIKLLNTHLQTVREEERAGIAREIHDELGQQLTALKMDVSWVKKKTLAENIELQERLGGMLTLIDQTVKVVRRIASDLRSGILDDLGLIAALEWQLSEFEKRMGIKTTFSASVNGLDLEKKLSIAIFRVYQEALTNIARHSGATQVDVVIEQAGGVFVLAVKDNGKGFDPETIKSKNALGLIGMTERVRMLNGELAIESRPETGTRVIITVPVQIIV